MVLSLLEMLKKFLLQRKGSHNVFLILKMSSSCLLNDDVSDYKI